MSEKLPTLPATYQAGCISIKNMEFFSETLLKSGYFDGDLGIQIADDGRIWICINGASFLRFKPQVWKQEEIEEARCKAEATSKLINWR